MPNIHPNKADGWFCEQLRLVTLNGEHRQGRNGGTKAVFGPQLELNISKEFPILTCKKMLFQASAGEMTGFIKGVNTAKGFRDLGCQFWNVNAEAPYWTQTPAYAAATDQEKAEGFLGSIYGVQWRDFGGVDQLQNLLEGLRRDPTSRYHIVSTWNPKDIADKKMALAPCHMMFQVFCHNDDTISLKMYQRSCDLFLGVPYNITGYALMLHLLAKLTGRKPRNLILTFGDFHIYDTHAAAVQQVLVTNYTKPAPILVIKDEELDWLELDFKDTGWLEPSMFQLEGYEPGPMVSAPMSQ